MFIVIERIEVNPEQRQHFVLCWRTVHEAIEEQCGSRGSRLHATEDGTYVGYVQWPDRDTWASCELPAKYAQVDESMRAACASMETLYELEVVMDLPGSSDHASS
jgi:heme-degrading monooxygenase HmoA